MTTAIMVHEVEHGEVWAKAWRKGPGSRHEMFAKLGVMARSFRDPDNPNLTGLLLEIPDMARFKARLDSDEGRTVMREGGLKVDTMRVLTEFTPGSQFSRPARGIPPRHTITSVLHSGRDRDGGRPDQCRKHPGRSLRWMKSSPCPLWQPREALFRHRNQGGHGGA